MDETADPVARWCGAAAVIGGAMWAVKGLAILLTGNQPPLLFEVPLFLFPIGLLGLHRRLRGQEERWERLGAVLAWLALGTATATGITVGVGRGDAPSALVGAGIALTALATVLGLVFLGMAAKRTHLFPGRWRSLAFVLGLCIPPGLTVVGGALESVHERLLEVPLVAIAFGWILLGALVALMPGRGQEASSVK
ncbi:MAG: hypothetical protein LC808_10475 [Actinobacteria bacterium]|nr:hypothetical protein [Actinomycetota bacterium]